MGHANAVQVAVGCVVLLLTLGLIVGLIMSAVRMRRPDANRRCYLSFIFFACGWLLYAAIAALAMKSELQVPATIGGLALFGVLGLSGVVLAILGLSELTRENNPPRRGKVPAVTTLVLAGLIAAMIAATFALGVAKGFTEAMRRRAGAEKAVFEDLHFSIAPPGGWTRLDPAEHNPLAAVLYRRNDPEAYLMIIAEKLEPGVGIDIDTVVQNVMKHLEEVSTDMRIVHQGDEVLNGLSGRRVVCEATIQGIPITYLYWFHVTPHRIHKLIAWGNRKDANAAIAEGRKAFEGFTYLPPK